MFIYKRQRELAGKFRSSQENTCNMLEYVGEWHYGTETIASLDDCDVFSWLKEKMDLEGLPAIMIIVGESNMRCFVEDIINGVNLFEFTTIFKESLYV